MKPILRLLHVAKTLSLAFLLTVAVATSATQAAPAPEVQLAQAGQARMPVVVGRDAAPVTRRAAEALAQKLSDITGGSFEVIEGDGTAGLAVGTPADFPALREQGLGRDFDPSQIEQVERYLLRSHDGGVYLLGATPRGAQNAVWALLDRMGYRQFLPGEKWEILPEAPTLALAVDVDERPTFITRRIWGAGRSDITEKDFFAWVRRNRANNDERTWDDGVAMDGGGFALQTGHVYHRIIRNHRAVFEQHPEYLALVNGKRAEVSDGNAKLCIANPALRELVVDWALDYFERAPHRDAVSMDPSDGSGWCECDDCLAMGSVTDRVVLLANQVAEAVTQQYPDKYVGIYAYNMHSPPPTIQVHPRVIVSIATSFARFGYTTDDLLTGWQTHGGVRQFGIRDYLSVFKWDKTMPGEAVASDLLGMAQDFTKYHQAGARLYSSEMGDNWGPYGLGYYLAARILWDIENAGRVDEIVDEFVSLCFGSAKEPMGQFFRTLYRTEDAWRRPMLSRNLIGQMYRLLAEAAQQSDDPAVQARLDDLALYTRYVELYYNYISAEGEADTLAALEPLMKHVYRTRGRYMINSLGVYDVLMRKSYRRVQVVPDNVLNDVPEGENPWKRTEPFTAEELGQIVARGIESNPVLSFEIVGYSDNLVQAAQLGLNDVPLGTFGKYGRRERTFFTWIDPAESALTLSVKAGLIYRNRGPAKFTLFPYREALGQSVDYAEVPPDQAEHPVVMHTSHEGLHRLTVNDSNDGTAVRWPDGTPMTREASATSPAVFTGNWQLCFYVPRGTTVVGGYTENKVVFHHDADTQVHEQLQPGYFTIAVPPGQDGKLWWAKGDFGSMQKFSLLTVPPYLARGGAELLLPTEVVTQDRP